jgi:hypothetical protein
MTFLYLIYSLIFNDFDLNYAPESFHFKKINRTVFTVQNIASFNNHLQDLENPSTRHWLLNKMAYGLSLNSIAP